MFRLGHMGNIDINDEVACLGVIERALIRCGVAVEPGKAIGIYMAEMAKQSQKSNTKIADSHICAFLFFG